MDSAPDICAAQREVLAANGRGDVSEEFLRRYIGRHLIGLFQDLGFASDAMDRSSRATAPPTGIGSTPPRAYFPAWRRCSARWAGANRPPPSRPRRPRAGAGAIRVDPALRSRAGHRWIPRQARAGCDSGVARAFGRDPEELSVGGRFGSRYGSRPARGRADLRGAVGLREPRGDGAVGAGLLDRRAAASYCCRRASSARSSRPV